MLLPVINIVLTFSLLQFCSYRFSLSRLKKIFFHVSPVPRSSNEWILIILVLGKLKREDRELKVIPGYTWKPVSWKQGTGWDISVVVEDLMFIPSTLQGWWFYSGRWNLFPQHRTPEIPALLCAPSTLAFVLRCHTNIPGVWVHLLSGHPSFVLCALRPWTRRPLPPS